MKTKLILDTDIGDDIDDAFALALAIQAPECDLVGVTTIYQDTTARATVACKLLHVTGRDDVPVATGRRTGDICRDQKKWAEGFATKKAITQPAAEFIVEQCKAQPRQITLVTIGPLTNLADALAIEPNLSRYVKAVVSMAGMADNEKGKDLPMAEWNVRCDVSAAKTFFAAGLNVAMVGLDVTMAMKVPGSYLDQLKASTTPIGRALEALRVLWAHGTPTMHDPLALAHALGHTFFDLVPRHIEVDDEARTLSRQGTPNATVALHPQVEHFMKYYFGTVLGE